MPRCGKATGEHAGGIKASSEIAEPPDILVSCLDPGEPPAGEVQNDHHDDEPDVNHRQVVLDSGANLRPAHKGTGENRAAATTMAKALMTYHWATKKKSGSPAERDQEP